MLERLKSMLIKEFIQVLRDPRMRFIIFVFPAVQIMIFGYAASTDVKHVPTAVYDLDNTPESRELTAGFLQSGYFELVEHVGSEGRVREILDRGDAKVVLRMNRGFGEILRAGRSAELQLLLDGTDSNTAGIVLGYASGIVSRFGGRVLVRRLSRELGPVSIPPGVELETRAWFNENLESRNYYIPGIIALQVFIITMLLSSMAVVREKEIGTMEQIIVTPITRGEFILGKVAPFVVIGFIDVAVLVVITVFWFEIPIRGSLSVLFFSSAIYLMSTLGFGLFISTISSTQQQAMMSAFFFIFPAILLSGFAFPVETMPPAVQWLTFLNPLRYFLVIIRGVFLKGVGVRALWPQMAALAILGGAILLFAVRRFRKTIQ